MYDALWAVVLALIRSWREGSKTIKGLVILCLTFFVLTAVSLLSNSAGITNFRFAQTLAGIFGSSAAAIAIALVARERLTVEDRQQAKIEQVEERARAHPDEPQLAWDLARTKLESYLDRNLSQLRSIFWLTSFIMVISFGLIFYGLLRTYDNPATLPVAIVAAASGVIVSFIGGSFLLVYRSILLQSRGYVSVLERINAVGMAVQVLGSISDDDKTLRNQSTATLAAQLIQLYAAERTEEPKDKG